MILDLKFSKATSDQKILPIIQEAKFCRFLLPKIPSVNWFC
jgi:hypothetical protein